MKQPRINKTTPIYCGRILPGKYSDELKQVLRNHIKSCLAFDEMGHAIIPYVAAWRIDTADIWYEFVSRRFLEFFNCTPENLGDEFSKSIVDRRVYKQENVDAEETVQERKEIDEHRYQIRQESVRKGVTQAVYKVQLPDERLRWFKDWASVEIYMRDGICLSPGYLADVTVEMDNKGQVDELNIVVEGDSEQPAEEKPHVVQERISRETYHEIRNPILSIGRMADNLSKQFPDGETKANLEVIVKEVGRLENVLKNIYRV